MRWTLVVSMLFLSCATVPNPPPSPPPGSACEAACQNLSRLGCPEGDDQDCVTTCTSAQVSGLTNLKPERLATAQTAEEVRAIGTVACDVGSESKAGTCANACATVKKYSCPEADGCLAMCSKATAGKLTNLKLSCLANAKSKAAMRGCGSVACP